MVDTDGTPVGTVLASDLLTSTLPAPFRESYEAGRAPRRGDEAALDVISAERADVRLGDRIGLSSKATARSYRVVGLGRLGETPHVGGAQVVLSASEAARVTGKARRVDKILVAGGPSPGALLERVAEVIPSRPRH